MKNIVMKITFDGTDYHGWQYQENGITVQEAVEDAVSAAIGSPVKVTGCSRTDAGVHALEYILNFKAETRIPTDKLPYAVNYRMRSGITALDAWEADESFNARFSVKGKRYVYMILNRRFSDPFLKRYTWHFPYALDVEKMNTAAGFFVGKHDFSGFMASGGQQATTVRKIDLCKVERAEDNPGLITVTVEAKSFLYNMVRIISGTLVYAGCGKIDPYDIPEIIESCDRRRGGITAPPQGLFLKKVYL